jgi:hypothetical protein
MNDKDRKEKKKAGEEKMAGAMRCHCPLCAMMEKMTSGHHKTGEFWQHLNNARIEVLEACRSLIDRRIEHLKEKGQGSSGGITKIKIEEQEA